jgi:hypothetical protein
VARRRKFRSIRVAAVAVMAVALVAIPGALAKRQVVRVGNLFLADNGGISPSKLPRHRQAPISGHISGEIGTTDGSHPPAVETVAVDFDKSLRLNAEGLPACPAGRVEARTTAEAKKACPRSIVGSGTGVVEVAFPESRPLIARGPIVLFSGGVHRSATRLLIHTYVSVPAPTAVVAKTTIERIDRGHFGLHTFSKIPVIAGGAGSVTKFELTIGRKFMRGKRRVSYLTASCPTGHYFTEGEVRFAGDIALGLTHALPCTPRE